MSLQTGKFREVLKVASTNGIGIGYACTVETETYEPAVKTVLNSLIYYLKLPASATGPEVGDACAFLWPIPNRRVEGTDIEVRIHFVQDNDTDQTNIRLKVGTTSKDDGEGMSRVAATDVTLHESQTIAMGGSSYRKHSALFTLLNATEDMNNKSHLTIVIVRDGEDVLDTYDGSIFIQDVEMIYIGLIRGE